jgi:hypothetical protein
MHGRLTKRVEGTDSTATPAFGRAQKIPPLSDLCGGGANADPDIMRGTREHPALPSKE